MPSNEVTVIADISKMRHYWTVFKMSISVKLEKETEKSIDYVFFNWISYTPTFKRGLAKPQKVFHPPYKNSLEHMLHSCCTEHVEHACTSQGRMLAAMVRKPEDSTDNFFVRSEG